MLVVNFIKESNDIADVERFQELEDTVDTQF